MIAAINDHAVAGGFERAMACDLAVCSERAKLGDQHANVGLVPGSGRTQRLPRLLGIRKAKELLYTGDMISADEAERLHLVNRVVPQEAVLSAAEELAAKIADKSPVAQRSP